MLCKPYFFTAQVPIKIEVRITDPSPANQFYIESVGNIMLECTLCLRNLEQWLYFVLLYLRRVFSYIKLLWINELLITFPGKMNY